MVNNIAAIKPSNGRIERGAGERGIEGNCRVLAWATRRMELLSVEMGKMGEVVGLKEDQELGRRC